jgi:hypothetical protein
MNYGICFAGVGVTHKKADKKEKTSLLWSIRLMTENKER